MTAQSDLAFLLGGLVDLVVERVVGRPQTEGLVATSDASTWHTRNKCAIAQRPHLALREGGANGTAPSTTAAPAPAAPVASTYPEVMAEAGVSRVGPAKVEPAPASHRRDRTAPAHR